MASSHLSIFDYQSFTAEIAGLTAEVERGDVARLQQLARRHLRRYAGMTRAEVEEKSPISCHGVWLPDDADFDAQPDNDMLGSLFLAILDSFLVGHCDNYHYFSLGRPLEEIGWREERLRLMFFGRPLPNLLGKESGAESVSSVKLSDPYWYWLRIDGGDAGWLTQQDTQQLFEELSRDAEKIRNFDVSTLTHFNSDDPVVCRDYEAGLHQKLDFYLAQFEAASRKEQGIFRSTILYRG